MPHRQIEVSAVDTRVLREVDRLSVSKSHFEVLSSVLAATLPRQPTAIQDCLKKAMEDRKVFLQYKVFERMLKNIGISMEYSKQKLFKELLVEKQIMRLSQIGDTSADVRYVH